MDPRTKDELLAENNELRQLLQAGVMLANAVLAGDDVTDDLQTWLAAVNAFFASQQP